MNQTENGSCAGLMLSCAPAETVACWTTRSTRTKWFSGLPYTCDKSCPGCKTRQWEVVFQVINVVHKNGSCRVDGFRKGQSLLARSASTEETFGGQIVEAKGLFCCSIETVDC